MPRTQNDQWFRLLALHTCFLLIIFSPILLGGAFVQKDAAMLTYPYVALTDARLFSMGMFWNDLNGHGFPSFLTFSFPLQPILLILLAFTTPVTALNLSVVTYAIAAAYFGSVFLRREGYSFIASAIGGATVAFAIWSWMFDITMSYFTPLFVGSLVLLQQSNRYWKTSLLGGVLVVALAWLGLHVHYAVIFSVGISAFVAARTINQIALRQKNPWRMCGVWCTSLVVGTGIGFLRLLPLYAYGRLSPRIALDAHASWWGMLRFGDLLQYLFADIAIPLLPSSGYGMTLYLGPFLVACSVIALGYAQREKRVWAYLCGALAFFAFVLPVTAKLLQDLPFMGALGSVSRWLTIANIALIPVCCIGIECVLKGRCKRMQMIVANCFFMLAIVMLLCAAILSLLPLLYSSFSGTISRSFDARFAEVVGNVLSSEHADLTKIFTLQFIESLVASAARQYGMGNTKIFGAALALLITGVTLHPRVLMSLRKQKATFLYAGFLLSLMAFFLPWTLRSRIDRSVYEVPPPLVKMVADSGGTLLAYKPTAVARQYLWLARNVTPLDATRSVHHLVPENENILWNIPAAGLYDGMIPSRILHMNTLTGTKHGTLESEESVPIDLLNVRGIRWILSGVPLNNEQLLFVEQEEISSARVPVYLYRNPGARPLAYFAERVQFVEPNEDAAFAVLESPSWTSETTVIECRECAEAATDGAKESSMELLEHTPTLTRLTTQTKGKQWLVLLRSYLPGWEIRIDGEPHRGAIANALFVAVELSPGTHEVTARFTLTQLLRDAWKMLMGKETVWS